MKQTKSKEHIKLKGSGLLMKGVTQLIETETKE